MQNKKPVFDALYNYSKARHVSFHVPGHKNGVFYNTLGTAVWENILHIDLTEIPGMDNLHSPAGIIKEAQDLAARAYGVDSTYFLVNGSTAGILAGILGTARPGDKVIIDRGCHSSVLNGVMLGRLEPVYFGRKIDSATGIPLSIDHEEVREIIENSGAKAIIVTNPNYYGICSDLEPIARLAHKHGMVLIVDEAHGAHLKFNNWLPQSAVDTGADLVVQSAHKTLPAMTQGAWLHVKGARVDRDRLERMLGVFQTTSPSYPLMASLDMARYVMVKEGKEMLETLIRHTRYTRESINLLNNGLFAPDSDYFKEKGCFGFDETRLIIHCRDAGMNGYQLDYRFRKEKGIYGELYDLVNWLGVTTPGNSPEDFDQLVKACRDIEPAGRRMGLPDMGLPVQKPRMKLWEVMEMERQRVPLEDARGLTAAASITPYPPGVPLVCPGEEISPQIINMIKLYAQLHISIKGYADGMVETVK